MAEIPDQIFEEITTLSERGNQLASNGQLAEALSTFKQALALVPEPQGERDSAFWLLVSIGDMEFLLGRYPESRSVLMSAVTQFEEARSNPFVRMRLGQSMYELGEEKEAANWLAGAYLSEGVQIFDQDDPKYLRFIKSQLEAPTGGWPDGW